jgi:spore coat protein JC
MTEQQIKDSGFAPYFIDHTAGLYPASTTGEPWTAAYMQSKGDVICDLTEDLAADAARERKTT